MNRHFLNKYGFLLAIALLLLCVSMAGQTPVVENVRFEQRTDGSLLVDIYYDVTTAGGLPLEVTIEASNDNGATWDLTCNSLTGDVGEDIYAGTNKHIVWNFYADNPDTSGNNYRVRVKADCMVCGQTITEDYTLTRDIICTDWDQNIPPLGYMIKMGAPDITFDLGGYSISSTKHNQGATGIYAESVDGITIRNGTIDKGFSWGIGIYNADSITIEDLLIKNLEFASPDTFIMGVIATECQGVVIQNCQFEFLDVHHKEAVVMGNNTEFTVDNIEVKNGSVGVNISGMEIPSVGTVTNSRFYKSKIAGVLVHETTNSLIKDNYFENGGGVSVDPEIRGVISGLIIRENDILNAKDFDGIQLRGGTDVTILNNNIRNNGKGISIVPSRGCNADPLNEIICIYSTNNVIRGNTVLGNNLDLYHDERCLGNTWENNIYESAQGSEIYTTDPVTAKQYLETVDSLAATVVADARLFFLNPWECDTTGTSMRWMYIYKSESQQKKYEFWVNDGKVFKRDSISFPWMISDGFLPYTENWIDSDSAMVIAQGMGGEDFCKNFELQNIEMSLVKTPSFFWTINYVAQDTIFQVSFDATLK